MKKEFNILIVDDNQNLAENLKDILEIEGFQAMVARSGIDAINLFSRHSFDLALVDLKLPDIQGIDLIKKLNKKGPATEYIIITAHGTIDHAVEAVAYKNILAFEMKPLDMDRLILLISQINKRKNAETSLSEIESRYKQLVDGSFTGIYIIQNNELKFCNQRFAEIFGYKQPEDLMGKSIFNLVSPQDWAMVEQEVISGTGDKKKSNRHEFVGIKKDETRINLEVLVGQIEYGNQKAVQGALLDITDRKKVEVEIKKGQEDLEKIVKKRTSELEKRNMELKRMNKLFVGREFRINELRNKLKELQKKLND